MRNIPRATYRVQLRQGLGFDELIEQMPYLAELGISHIYLSPCFRAAEGSTHGYDVVDPNRVDDAIGGEAGRERFLSALQKHGLEHVIDVVPNHMSVTSAENRWWWDVLENGPASSYAPYFDVDWDGPTEMSRSTVLLPSLTEHYGRALEAKQINVAREPSAIILIAMGRRLPLSLPTLSPLLLAAAESVRSRLLEFLGDSLVLLPEPHTEADRKRRHRHQRVIMQQLFDLFEAEPETAAEVDRRIALLNDDTDALDELIQRQHYRLAHYRIARYDLDYRRFFDINDLAALLMHDPVVFERTHALVFDWINKGELGALRVDHPDGLRDPAEYFRKLRAGRDDLWIIAEKILEPGEQLPDDWPVDGTTGYDFLNVMGGLYVDVEAEPKLTELYRDFLGLAEAPSFAEEVHAAKRSVLDELLASDLWRLTRLFQRICASKRRHHDFAHEELRRALREVIACLPVYRTYVRPQAAVREFDLRTVTDAVAAAGRQRVDLDAELLGFLQELLSGKCLSELEWDFVSRFQQLSSAAMAKGLEDTAFYRYMRLTSLNEVGGDPAKFGTGLDEFHDYCVDLQRRWPNTMIATTTHDTKRSEDARLRISALSEVPDAWAASVRDWSSRAAAHRRRGLPDPATEYLVWQTLVGAFPLSEQRLLTYLEKAMREAKLKTSWLNQDADYEAAVLGFAKGVLADTELMASVREFVSGLLPAARYSSLSQTLIKLTACGVPDIYQGSELWDTRLTDPDNRGAVDIAQAQKLLSVARHASAPQVLDRSDDGLPKLWLLMRVLEVRARRPNLFAAEAQYRPLHAEGLHAARALSYARGDQMVVIAPRLWSRVLSEGWGDTRLSLPKGRFRNVFDRDASYTGEVALAEALRSFPVALLIQDEAG